MAESGYDVPAWPEASPDPVAAAKAINTNEFRGPLATTMGIEMLRAGPDEVVARMPVAGNTQPYGLLHGGASVALAETLGSSAGMLAARGDAVVGLEINANHLRAVRSGLVTGTARPLHVGRSTQVWEIRIEDAAGKPVCISRITLAVLPKPPASGQA